MPPIPMISRVVMVGYGLGLLGLLITATEIFWRPSLASTTAFLFWGFVSNVCVFIYFLGTYVDVGDESSKSKKGSTGDSD